MSLGQLLLEPGNLVSVLLILSPAKYKLLREWRGVDLLLTLPCWEASARTGVCELRSAAL